MATEVDFEREKAIIKKQPFFAQFTDQEIDVLATLFIEKLIPEGTTIVEEGEPVDSVYLIVRGTAEVRHVTVEDGKLKNIPLAILGENKSIGLGETGFYSLSGVRTATVVALTEMLVLRLSVAAFHGFALANSHVAEIMHRNEDAIDNK